MRKIFFPNKYRKTQIETPYTKLSQNELLDKFKTENWSKMTTDERINTLQELENRYALEQNRPVARVEAETVRSLGGSYSNFSNVIRVNVTDLPNNNSFEQLDSYYHESRHASQYQAMKTGKGIDQTTRNMCKVELDCGNYAGQGDDYDMQTCEMDSNNTASQKMLEHSERYKGDANYRTYLKSKYCTRSAPAAFSDLIKNIKAKYIVVSYNNMANKGNDRSNARLSDVQILNTLNEKGSVKIFSTQFKAFTTGKSEHLDNEERLFVCKCN